MSSNKLPSSEQINELSKSDQLSNDEQQVSNGNSTTLTEISFGGAHSPRRLSVQIKPHSVHSLDEISKDTIKVEDKVSLVKSDSQLNNLGDEFINPEMKNDLDKSLENLKIEQTSLDQLTIQSCGSLNKASLNNLLLNDQSLNELSTITNAKPLNNTPISDTYLNDQIIRTSLNQSSLESSSIRKPSLKQTFLNTPELSNKLPEKASSLVELNDTNRKLKEIGKQSTGSIDFTPTYIAGQSTFEDDKNRINVGLEDEMTLEGYKPSLHRFILYILGCILTFPALYIYTGVKKELRIRLTYKKCPLNEATIVILKDHNKVEYVEDVVRPDRDEDTFSNNYAHFHHKKLKYIWQSDKEQFIRLIGLESEKCEVIYSYLSGLNHQEAEDKFNLYGKNSIYIDVQPMWKIIVETIQNPFYIYQVFIVIVWCVQVYYSFAACVFAFSIITIALQSLETRKQDKLLRAKVQSENEVTVIRNSCTHRMSSEKLVPGDLLVLTKPCPLNCDAVLVEGTCTVNESMLTGECVPIQKSSLTMKPESIYSPKTNKKNTMYCGTDILQVSAHNAKAVVVRTGYTTAKGELVRAILFPKEEYSFLNSDLLKCIQLFLLIGAPCMAYTAYNFYSYKLNTFELIMIVIDVATFLIPPLLPSVMTSINVHAQKRLLKQDIFCLNATTINSCGILDTTVFDKTGTITEDSLDFASVLSTSSSKDKLIEKFLMNDAKEDENLNEINNASPEDHLENNVKNKNNFVDEPWTQLKDRELSNPLMTVGCCHSLIYFDNKVDGDILDLKMFEQMNWEISDSKEELEQISDCLPDFIPLERVIKTDIQKNDLNLSICIVKEFQFESSLQRMMVIVKPLFHTIENNVIKSSPLNNDNYLVLVKGAPERIEKFCKSQTIPENYDEILYAYTTQGLRVIACASKVINLSELNNLKKSQITDFENDLVFDGFIIFHNKIKRQSKPTIEELKSIDIRCLMATGDNLLTGINVARNCGLIESDSQVIELKSELVSNKTTTVNGFIDRNVYVEYLDSDHSSLNNMRLKLTYKILRNTNSIQDQRLTKLFRKESHHHDQDEVIINMLDNSRMKEKNRLSIQSISWFRRRDEKHRLSKTINELDNDQQRRSYHLCCEGSTFQLLRYHNQRIFQYLTHKGVVFARMAPNQKEQLITGLQKQDHMVAMVGDGANDCAALRNANCGLSLSSGESAVAAPFSTTHSNISVFKYLICEGKATITATFGAFKYQVSYCFLLLSAVMILFYDGCSPTDIQYVLTDIVLNVLPPMVFGTTAAYYKLVKRRPSKILFGFSTLFSIFSFVLLQSCFYFFARWLLTQQTWYEPFRFNINQFRPSPPSDIATTIISVNVMSYIISAIIFSPGHPFRRSFFSNKLYMAVVLLNFIIVLTITFYPTPKFVLKYISFKEFPEFRFKLILLLINIVNFFVSYAWEVVFLQTIVPVLQERYSNLATNRKIPIYEKLDSELFTSKWPPVLFDSKN